MLVRTVRQISISHSRWYAQDVSSIKETTEKKPEGWNEAKPYDAIPGPKPAPIIGNVWRLIFGELSGFDIVKQHKMLREKYGSVVGLKKLGSIIDLIILYEPKEIEKMYRNEGLFPVRDGFHSLGHYRSVIRKDIFGDVGSLLSSQGEAWQNIRSKVNPVLMQPRTAMQYVQSMDEVASDFIERIKDLAKQNPLGEMPEDFDHELNKWAFESVGVIALDTRLGCLDKNPNAESQKMVEYMVELFKMMAVLDFRPYGIFCRKYNIGIFKKFVEYQDYFTNLTLKHIDKAAEKIKQDVNYDSKSEQDKSAFEKLLKKDKTIAMVMTLDMLSAGIDTTGKTTASILYFLAKHPEKQNELRKELKRLLPRPDTPITKELLEEMLYVKAVIKEAQRIAPIIVASSRATTKEIVLGGYQIPPGVNIVVPSLNLSLDKDHYKNPNEFIPERWLKSTTGDLSYKNTNPFVTLPFGFGARSCIGKRLALLEIQIILAKIVRNFELEWPHPDMKFGMVMLYGVEGPLKIRVKQITQ